jgi:hypothetical protein
MTVAGIPSSHSFALPPLPSWLKTTPKKISTVLGGMLADSTLEPFKAIYELGSIKANSTANLPVLLNDASGVIPDMQQFLVTLAEKSVSATKTFGGHHIGDSFKSSTVPHLVAALGTIDTDTLSTDIIMALPLVKGGLKAWGLYQKLRQESTLSPLQTLNVLSSHLFKL